MVKNPPIFMDISKNYFSFIYYDPS